MLAALITIEILVIVYIINRCIASWKNNKKDKYIAKWIEQRKKEEKEEFKGFFFCDDDCYMCGDLERCKKAVEKEG